MTSSATDRLQRDVDRLSSSVATQIERLRSAAHSEQRLALLGTIIAAAIGAAATLGASFLAAQPQPVACTESLQRAIEIYQTSGLKIDLPDESREQEQCDLEQQLDQLGPRPQPTP
ncbi:hypothetical protein [Microbacterium pumilum]|uniref:Uncharacterized protein n=1 Tax=Microbacterium pumilum TaxID=344165 RepID=A0ABP5EGL5_9MICO